MSPLEIILLSVCIILFISCLGLALLYRRASEDSVRLEWFVRKEARMFLRSGFLRWSGNDCYHYVDLHGRDYRTVIDTGIETGL